MLLISGRHIILCVIHDRLSETGDRVLHHLGKQARRRQSTLRKFRSTSCIKVDHVRLAWDRSYRPYLPHFPFIASCAGPVASYTRATETPLPSHNQSSSTSFVLVPSIYHRIQSSSTWSKQVSLYVWGPAPRQGCLHRETRDRADGRQPAIVYGLIA